jgi:hypothetical protein
MAELGLDTDALSCRFPLLSFRRGCGNHLRLQPDQHTHAVLHSIAMQNQKKGAHALAENATDPVSLLERLVVCGALHVFNRQVPRA